MSTIAEQFFNAYMAKILIVDDNRTARWIVVEHLKRIGLSVDQAADGREAVECMKTARYQLILMDIDMPELDGLEATRQIRVLEQQHGWQPARIIAYTAGCARHECVAAGMDDYLQKPVTGDQLTYAIEKWLGK